MSTFKKIVSIMLCIAMLAGSFTMLGSLAAPGVSAAEGESKIKKYADLAAQYDNFVYIGSEIYEIETADGTLNTVVTDRELTDYYVDAGQLLEERIYMFGDFYFGSSTYIVAYDNKFFDVTQVTTTAVDTSGYSTAYGGVVNTEHPLHSSHELTNLITSADCATEGWMKSRSGYTADILAKYDYVQSILGVSGNASTKAFVFDSEENWLVSWTFKVKEGLADNTTGWTGTMPGFWNCGDLTADKPGTGWQQRKGSVAIHPGPIAGDIENTVPKSSNVNYSYLDYLFLEDLEHTFTIGANPNAGGGNTPSGPVAGTSKIKKYADLAAQYDNFVYIGSEIYEIETADGTLNTAVTDRMLTDYYVDAGQLLEERIYMFGDFYFGSSTYVVAYDNTFFDVTQVTTTAVDTSGYSTAYGGVVNTEHPLHSSHELTNLITSADCATEGWMKSRSGYTADILAKYDYVQSILGVSGNASTKAFVFDSEENWLVSWTFKVKEGLADNTTGWTGTMPGFWNCGDLTADKPGTGWQQRKGSVAIHPGPIAGDIENTVPKSSNVNYSYLDYLFLEDLEHTFTIGANPNAGGGTAKTYTIKFLENDGTEIPTETTEYKENDVVAVPDAVGGQIGWVNTAIGSLVDLTDYVAVRNAEFKRVLATDEFDVVLDIGDGKVDALPEGATLNDNGDIVITANFNEEINLNEAVPAPVKEGYTGTWSPETVKIDNIKGANASVVWTANTYKASFYVNKEDEEPVVMDVTYNQTVRPSVKAPAGMKFAAWKDVETGEQVSDKESFKYTFASDKSFYAEWTQFNSSITFMTRDYENGGWKVAAVKYNNKGETLSANEVNDILTGIEKENNVSISMSVLDTPYISSNAEFSDYVDTTAGVVYDGQEETDAEGNKTYKKVLYVGTEISFNITWKVPVFENGEKTGEFISTTTTPKTVMSGKSGVYSVFAKTNADATPPAYHSFKGWIDEATNKTIDYTKNGVELNIKSARTLVYVADIQETEYQIQFVVNREGQTSQIVTAGVKIGEAIDPSAIKVTTENGTEVELPEIGQENSTLKVPFMNNNGFAFTGWKIGAAADAKDFTMPVTLTTEFVDQYASGEIITINSQWEALVYELKFYYATPESDMSLPVEDLAKYAEEPIVVKYKTGETISMVLSGENLEKVKANTPEGYEFQSFAPIGSPVNKMPGNDLNVYASYTLKSIPIYVDYNNGKGELKDTMALSSLLIKYPVSYGDDIEREEDVENDITMGVGTLIMRSIIDDANKPGGEGEGKSYEVVKWNRYHIKSMDDLYKPENWIKGINDEEGSTIAESIIIYQPEWKHHSEFFFRVYGTDGKIFMALGKNFKLYYWNNDYVCERGDTTVNKDKENNIILLYKIAFETEGGLTMRLDPVVAPKSMFTFEAMVALFGALGNLIKGLL